MVGVIDGFRWCLLGGNYTLSATEVVSATLGLLILICTGVWYFRKTERTFADVI